MYEDSIDKATGLPMKDAHKDRFFRVHGYINYAERALAKKRADDEQKARRANKGKLPEFWNDGRHYYVVTADDPRGEGVSDAD